MTGHVAQEGTPEPEAGWRSALSPWLPDVLAFLVAGLVYLFSRGGLFPPDASGVVQVGVVCGALSGLSASSAVRGGAAAFAAVLVGAIVAPVFGVAMIPWSLVAALAAGLAAFGAKWVIDGGHLRPTLVVAFAAVLVLANFWLSTATLARDQVVVKGQTLFEFLSAPPTPGSNQPDQMFHNAVLFKMRGGQPFYSAYREAFRQNGFWGADPPSVISVREPLLPSVLSRLPGGVRGPIWAMAFLASVAMLAAMWLPRNLASPSVRFVSVVAVAAYMLAFTTTPLVIGYEAWGACFAMLSAAVFSLSMERSSGDAGRRWMILAAAALAVAAVAVREIMVFLPVAGLVAAFFAEKDRRRFDLAVWGTALGSSFLVWGAHALAARGIVTPSSEVLGRAVVFGGYRSVIAAIKYGAFYVTTYRPLLIVLALLGIAGAFLQREKQYRVFMVLCLLLPLAAFFVAWNRAIDEPTGAQVNYWGAVVGPLLFAMIPAALGAIPGAGRDPLAAEDFADADGTEDAPSPSQGGR